MATHFRERRGAARFRREVETMTKRVDAERPRAKALLGETRPGAAEPELREALESLQVHHEELSVAEEELRAQVEELTAMGLALESERARYMELFELAPDGYVVTDRSGVIQQAN